MQRQDNQPNNKQEVPNQANRVILKRTIQLMVLFGILVFLPLFWKLWDIQIVNGDKYEEMAINQQTSDLTVTAPRGTIYDAKGNILAISSTVQNIIISPKEIITGSKEAVKRAEAKIEASVGLTPEEKTKKKLDLTQAEQAAMAGTYDTFIAQGLADILGLDVEAILARMDKTTSMYEVLARRVEEDISVLVNEFVSENRLYPGVYLRPDTKRYYPYGSLASQVIGWVNPNNDNKGAYGLEARYEEVLAGTAGRVITARNAAGTEMLSSYENYIDPQPGQNLHLTIDATIQNYCERMLAEGIASYEVRNGGFCIAMDPNTGAVMALASSPGYDLNDPWGITDPIFQDYLQAIQDDPNAAEDAYLTALGEFQLEQWRNKALTDAYEPGSTFKTLVVAAALEEGVVSEGDHFYCTGSKVVADWTIRCSKKGGHGDQTLAKAVANSCNPAFIEIGQKLGAEKFYDYLEAYGFFEKTGLDTWVEGTSQIWDRADFTSEQGIASLATASFGQTLKITPIQMITAACAAVNGGHLMEPYYVSSITDQQGAVVESFQPVEVRQVVSEATSAKVREMLEGVVDGGTGKNAYMAGYRIGGKTGTSEKRDEKTGDLIVSFLSVAPANDPKVVILLAFDSPTPVFPGSDYTSSGMYISGGNMAALSAGTLTADILSYLGVEKVYNDGQIPDQLVPQTVGLSVSDAQALLESVGLSYRIVTDSVEESALPSALVLDQLPTQGNAIPAGSEVVLYLDGVHSDEPVEVPGLQGYPMSTAVQLLERRGLYMRVEGVVKSDGTAIATNQSIEAGTVVDPGTVVTVHFMSDEVDDYAENGNIGQGVG